MFINLVFTLGGIVLGLVLMFFFFKGKGLFDLDKRRVDADSIISKAKAEAEQLINDAKKHIDSFNEKSKEGTERREARIKQIEKNLSYKGNVVKKRNDRIEEIKGLTSRENDGLKELYNAIEELDKKSLEQLVKTVGLSIDELKAEILNERQKILDIELENRVSKVDEEVKENAQKIAKKILVTTIQRICSNTSVERRAVHVTVPRDDVKGKIVGKNAENIIYFEDKLGVSVVFNDLPHTISLSCFNLVQRRIGQVAMEKLVLEKKDITKKVMDKAIEIAEKEVNEELFKIGEKAVKKMRLKEVPKEFLQIIGRLKYRTSYGQNIMKHSMEVGYVAEMIGAELGVDADVCRVAGFLHDVGKAIDQDPNEKDAHDYITKELMEKYGFSWEEVHAAWVHHDAIPSETAEAFVIKAADAVSAGRPGARQESIFSYEERIRDIEDTVNSFDDISKIFTMSAGREIRAYVDTKKKTDGDILPMAENIAHAIEERVAYPGKIRVNVIRRIEYKKTAKGQTSNK